MSTPRLIDTHCHLDFPDYGEDLDAVLDRAREAGVGLMVTICTHLSKFPQVLAVAERYRNVYCSVGIHPHEAASEAQAEVDTLVHHASHPRVVGIGETGLDYFYEHSPRATQKAQFRSHIRAARKANVPLIVHTRDADEDTIAILHEAREEGPFPGLIHCFSTSRAVAEAALDCGLFISVAGIVTFKKAEDLRATVRDIPLDRLLVETDSPFLAPVPKRGKRNEPALVAHTAACIAETRGMTVQALADTTTANALRLFSKIDPADALWAA